MAANGQEAVTAAVVRELVEKETGISLPSEDPASQNASQPALSLSGALPDLLCIRKSPKGGGGCVSLVCWLCKWL